MTMAMAMTMTAQFCSKPMAVSSLVSPPDDAAMQAAPIEKVELRMETVSKSYGGRRVVDAISMSVRQGEVVGLLGSNGAGKSTTFNILVGRESPCAGGVFLGSLDVTMLSLPHRARLGIGYMTQEASVFRGLSVHDNIRLILQETGVPRAQHARRVRELLEKFALQAVENTMGSALSGGERRRTELARVLASNCAAGGPPKILLVDEPFAGVDPIGVAEMQKQLRRLCEEENMGIMITDHNVNETLRICDRAYMVHNGCVMASGGPEGSGASQYLLFLASRAWLFCFCNSFLSTRGLLTFAAYRVMCQASSSLRELQCFRLLKEGRDTVPSGVSQF